MLKFFSKNNQKSKSDKRNSKSDSKFYGIPKLIFRIFKLAFILFFGLSLLGVIGYRFINPPFTWLMIERGFQRKSAGAAEDQTFLEHHGFDFNAIEKAIEKNSHSKKLIGGSTISQQVAKNVFLWEGRSILRKGIEAYFTVLIETFWSKKRIMEVYLNEIEMGDGIYGVEAASQAYFHKSASDLTRQEAAAIAVIFPSPLKWSATNPTKYLKHRQYLIMKNMRRLGPLDF